MFIIPPHTHIPHLAPHTHLGCHRGHCGIVLNEGQDEVQAGRRDVVNEVDGERGEGDAVGGIDRQDVTTDL